MRAACIDRLGGPDEIHPAVIPVPSPGPGEVLVRTLAMGVNHVDTFVRSGAYRTELPMPFVIGRDLIGDVADLGEGVTGFAERERVWCHSLGLDGRQGAFSEYAVVPADRLYPAPAEADPVETVSVLHTLATAYLGLEREARLGEGETVFIGGAGGGVGSAAVQLAASHGATVIASASPGDFDWVRSCGADQVVDYHDESLLAACHDLAPHGLDVHWDCSGHSDLADWLSLMRPGGRMLLSAGLDGRIELPAGAIYTRDLSLHGFAMSNASVDDLAASAHRINALLAVGGVLTRVGRVLPLPEAAMAHRLLETESTRSLGGRLVVVPDDLSERPTRTPAGTTSGRDTAPRGRG